jgi:hypothetical protein
MNECSISAEGFWELCVFIDSKLICRFLIGGGLYEISLALFAENSIILPLTLILQRMVSVLAYY